MRVGGRCWVRFANFCEWNDGDGDELVGFVRYFHGQRWNRSGPAFRTFLGLGGSTAVDGLRCFPGRDVGIKGNIGRSFA